jgi:hypothetical protein
MAILAQTNMKKCNNEAPFRSKRGFNVVAVNLTRIFHRALGKYITTLILLDIPKISAK